MSGKGSVTPILSAWYHFTQIALAAIVGTIRWINTLSLHQLKVKGTSFEC